MKLEDLKKESIGVFGDGMLDRYVLGRVERVSPEAPIPVVLEREERSVLGGAANVSRNLGDFGLKTQTVTLVGVNSEDTDIFLTELKSIEGGVQGVVRDLNRPTTTKLRVLGNGQQIVRIDRECSEQIDGEVAQMIEEKLLKVASSVRSIIVADVEVVFHLNY